MHCPDIRIPTSGEAHNAAPLEVDLDVRRRLVDGTEVLWEESTKIFRHIGLKSRVVRNVKLEWLWCDVSAAAHDDVGNCSFTCARARRALEEVVEAFVGGCQCGESGSAGCNQVILTRSRARLTKASSPEGWDPFLCRPHSYNLSTARHHFLSPGGKLRQQMRDVAIRSVNDLLGADLPSACGQQPRIGRGRGRGCLGDVVDRGVGEQLDIYANLGRLLAGQVEHLGDELERI